MKMRNLTTNEKPSNTLGFCLLRRLVLGHFVIFHTRARMEINESTQRTRRTHPKQHSFSDQKLDFAQNRVSRVATSLFDSFTKPESGRDCGQQGPPQRVCHYGTRRLPQPPSGWSYPKK